MENHSLLLRGGCLIDPAQGYHSVRKDVLIENGVFTRIEDRIEPVPGVETLELDGAYVAPGFIDIHTHVLDTVRHLGLPADMIGVAQGTTTVVDAGTAGPATMETLVEDVIKKSRTRVYSAMHYATDGLKDPPEADDPSKYDLETGKAAYAKYAPYIVAIKARASNSCVGQLGITSIRAGKELARAVGKPLLVHIGHMPPTIEEVLDLMDKGDIITHAFHGKDNNLLENGAIKPQTQAARDRGVLFDVGHGKDSFNFNTGRVARSLGFYPDTISTDLHTNSFHKPVHSLAETLGKFLELGYTLEECIDKVTAKPAQYLGLDKLGKLKPGCLGDVTVFRIKEGEYTFIDANKNELHGTRALDVRYAIVGGKVEMDADDAFHQLCRAASVPDWRQGEFDYMARQVLAYAQQQGVRFDGEHLAPFQNHIIALITRLTSGEHVAPMGEEMLEQLEPKTLAVTDGIVNLVEPRYGAVDTTERILIAIHIQTAMENCEENH